MAKGKYAEWLEPDGLLLIEGWARDGLTNEQIARNMGISRETLNQWKKQFSDISDALKKGKEVVDRIVENALFERAKGGIHAVKKTFKVKEVYYDEYNRKCEKETLVQGTDEVYVPGDTTAQIFWLKKRKPDMWGDKAQNTDDSNQDDGFIDALNSTAVEDWTENDADKKSNIQV